MTEIKIVLDDTVKGVEIFQSLKDISIDKTELFKYAIMMWDIPKHIVDSDFDYLQSKVPALEMLLNDHISLTNKGIQNLSEDDRVQKFVSEALGVGIGLKYTIDLLNTNPSKLKKIAPLTDGKYLDYSTIKNGKEYEIETKGTISKYYSRFKNDIISKKENSKSKKVHLRFGTIAMFSNSKQNIDAKCVIVDDPPENIEADFDDTFKTQLLSYASFLSHIFDSKYYNKYIKPIENNSLNSVRINENKFFGKYIFDNNEYYGEYFDYRLIKEKFEDTNINANTSQEFFKRLTEKVGNTKIFIGLDKVVIDAINRKDIDFLNIYNSQSKSLNNNNKSLFLDKDGIIIVKSKNKTDKQIEKFMSEKEVFRRLGLYNNYNKGRAHKCGAPCRSKDIEGKPCDIRTYRGNCHFHR